MENKTKRRFQDKTIWPLQKKDKEKDQRVPPAGLKGEEGEMVRDTDMSG